MDRPPEVGRTTGDLGLVDQRMRLSHRIGEVRVTVLLPLESRDTKDSMEVMGGSMDSILPNTMEPAPDATGSILDRRTMDSTMDSRTRMGIMDDRDSRDMDGKSVRQVEVGMIGVMG